jgi:transposase
MERNLIGWFEGSTRELRQKGISVRVGLEATGYSRWFERLLAELGIEVWIGDAAEIKTKRVRKQKTDREDAKLLLKLLLENRFPRIWYRVQRIVICGNCCGTGIGWCRCGRGS